jgi:hypothetical protein
LTQINCDATPHAIMTPCAAASGAIACGPAVPSAAAQPENVMIRLQYRSTLATSCVFIALASLLGVVHAMLIDEQVAPYAIVALVSGIVGFVAQLNPASSER